MNRSCGLPPVRAACVSSLLRLTYGDPADIEYQYLLEGADKDWSAWGKQKEANYSGLGPGNYRFRVRARERRRPSQSGRHLRLHHPAAVVPHHAGLHPLCVFFCCSLAVAAWRFISRHEREKARRKTEALEAQAKALEATVNERTRGDSRTGRRDRRAERQHRAAQRDRQRDHRLARSQHHPVQALRASESDRGCEHLRRRPLPAAKSI